MKNHPTKQQKKQFVAKLAGIVPEEWETYQSIIKVVKKVEAANKILRLDLNGYNADIFDKKSRNSSPPAEILQKSFKAFKPFLTPSITNRIAFANKFKRGRGVGASIRLEREKLKTPQKHIFGLSISLTFRHSQGGSYLGDKDIHLKFHNPDRLTFPIASYTWTTNLLQKKGGLTNHYNSGCRINIGVYPEYPYLRVEVK